MAQLFLRERWLVEMLEYLVLRAQLRHSRSLHALFESLPECYDTLCDQSIGGATALAEIHRGTRLAAVVSRLVVIAGIVLRETRIIGGGRCHGAGGGWCHTYGLVTRGTTAATATNTRVTTRR